MGSSKKEATEPVPRFARLRRIEWRGDLFGGITTAVVSLPMALAFGVASGAGPEAGLYGAVIVGLFAALFGGSNTLISEPTGPMTVIMTAVVASMLAENPELGLAAAFGVVIVAGVIQILFGLLQLGRYITLMPYSVVSGFMSGIGLLLIVLQLPVLLGHTAPAGTGALDMLMALPGWIVDLDPREAGLAAATLGVLFGIPAAWRRVVPPPLAALGVGVGIAAIAFDAGQIHRIGSIPMGLPEFRLPAFPPDLMTRILLDGTALGVLGGIDTLLTAMIADSLTRDRHDSNRELIGQGIGNIVSGFFGGLPGAGATMGTVVNVQAGARTPWAAVTRALLLLVVVGVAAPMLETVPRVVLSAIAFKVGFDILDWSFLRRAHRISHSAALIMYGVAGLTVFVDLIVAVGVGVFVANVLTIERLSALQADRVKAIDPSDDAVSMTKKERALFDRAAGRVVLFHLSGPMIFGVANAISREHEAIREAEALVLDLTDVPMLSTTVALALENVIEDAHAVGCQVWVSGASGAVEDLLRRLEVIGENGDVATSPTRLGALERALAALDAKP